VRTLNSWLRNACAAVLLATASTANAADVTLQYSSWLPPQYWVNVEVMNPWFKEIERVTEGRVVVETLPKVVGTAQSQIDVIRDGLADISFISPGYTPGRFPILSMGDLPFFEANNAEIVAPAFFRIYEKHMQKHNEFDGVKLVSVWVNGPGHVFTAKKPVKTVADFQGLKLRAAGPVTSDSLELLGAVPILKPATEVYEMLSTGVIDGALMQFDSLKGTNLIDLVDQGTLIKGGIFHSALAVIMSPAAWDKISPKDQEAIAAISNEHLAALFGKAHDVVDGRVIKEIEEAKKITMAEASREMQAELREKLKPIEQAWIAKAKEAGLEDPEAVLADFRKQVVDASPK